MLLSRCPHADIAILVDFDVNQVWPATNGAVLDVLLAGAARKIDGNDDLLAAGITDVTGLVLHNCLGRHTTWLPGKPDTHSHRAFGLTPWRQSFFGSPFSSLRASPVARC